MGRKTAEFRRKLPTWRSAWPNGHHRLRTAIIALNIGLSNSVQDMKSPTVVVVVVVMKIRFRRLGMGSQEAWCPPLLHRRRASAIESLVIVLIPSTLGEENVLYQRGTPWVMWLLFLFSSRLVYHIEERYQTPTFTLINLYINQPVYMSTCASINL